MITRSVSSGVETGAVGNRERDYGIHQIRISTPIPGFKVNIYLVESPFPTLIDAPPDERRFLDQLEAGLGLAGYSIEDIRRIIVTHPHFDHFGASKTIAEKSGAEIWVSESGAAWLEDYEKELPKVARFRRRLLQQAGGSTLDIQYMDGYFERGDPLARAVEISRRLKEGDRFDLSSMPFRVTDVPGHTQSCILIHDVDNHMAFTGDFLVRDIASSPLIQRANVEPEEYKSLKSYIGSLKKMRDMNFEIAFPGHGEIVENPSARIDELLAFIAERREKVLEILKKGDRTPVEISHELFPDLPQDQLFSGVCDVLGHLQILEEEGLARRRGLGPVYFSATC